MKRWKQNKAYVYYLPEYDQIYVATYKPTDRLYEWTSVLEFDFDDIHPQNFNPDILVPYIWADGSINCPSQAAKTIYLGEL